MHRQIKVVAILMMVEGGFEALMGIFFMIMGPVMMSVMRSAPPPSHGTAPPPEIFAGVYMAMGAVTLIGAIVKIIAGIRNVTLKSRVLGFIGLGSCLLSFASCYCVPTALGLGIYGLIVYLNDKSAQAFALGDSGMPSDQILAQLDGMPPQQPYPQQYPPYPPR